MKRNYKLIGLMILPMILLSCNHQVKDEVKLSSIEATKQPSKAIYKEGDVFIPDGMEITAKFSDSTTKIITDYTYSPSEKLTPENKTITVTYEEEGISKTTEISITVFKIVKPVAFDCDSPKSNYKPQDFEITGGLYTLNDNIISLTPEAEGTEYTITGYFEGQIKNESEFAKNTVLKLKNAYLENTVGQPVIYSAQKIEISLSKETVNYIVSSGDDAEKTGAILSEKGIELGGSGIGYIAGNICHGIKGSKIKAKGNGTYYIRGTSKGSAINASSFTIEKDKTVTIYLLDSKNGIKADETISVESGIICLDNVGTGLKTDTSKDDPEAEHYISLTNCAIYTKSVTTFYKTEDNGYLEDKVLKEEM